MAEKENPRPVFSPGVALGLVAVGVVSLLFYLVFAAYAPDFSGDSDSRENALSHSAVGFAGLADLLQYDDVSVTFNRGLAANELAKAGLLVLTPSLENSGADVQAVSASEPKLIILPKWMAAPDLTHPGWVQNAGTLPTADIAKQILEPISKSSKLARATGNAASALHDGFDGAIHKTGAIESLQTISGKDWIGYVMDEKGRAVVARLTGTNTYVLADPDLMNTHGLKDEATAEAAMAIIGAIRIGRGPIIFDLTLARYRRAPNFLRLAFEPPFLGATLAALMAALLMGIHAATRFGAPLEGSRAFQLGKRALADNSAALIAMTHREHHIVIRYATAIRNRVARRIGVIRGQYSPLTDDALNDMLDRQRRDASSTPMLAELFREARDAKNANDAVAAARRFYRWRREMIHER